MSQLIMAAAGVLRPPPTFLQTRRLAGRSPSPAAQPQLLQRRRNPAYFCAAQVPVAELAHTTAAFYGALLLGGGTFAYSRTGSKGSLAGGVSGAVLMGTVYYLTQAPQTNHLAYALGFGTAFIFSAVFGIRFAATQKFVPSGALLGVSILSVIVFVSAYMQKGV